MAQTQEPTIAVNIKELIAMATHIFVYDDQVPINLEIASEHPWHTARPYPNRDTFDEGYILVYADGRSVYVRDQEVMLKHNTIEFKIQARGKTSQLRLNVMRGLNPALFEHLKAGKP